MCVMSMVIDHFEPRIPDYNKWFEGLPKFEPAPQTIASEIEELRKILVEFREAVAAAKKVDELTAQPDCVDPEKEKLVARVDELERRLAALEPKRKPRRKRVNKR
jgi:hypothetical protein